MRVALPGGACTRWCSTTGALAAALASPGQRLSVRRQLYVRYAGLLYCLRLICHGLRDLDRAVTGRTPHYLPIVAEPGQLAAVSTTDAKPATRH
jgi:uncharacterized protein